MKTTSQPNAVHTFPRSCWQRRVKRQMKNTALRKPTATAHRKKRLTEFLMDSPLAGANLDLERRKECPRSVEL